MAGTSRIIVKRLSGTVENVSYSCAQDVKSLYGNIQEYTYTPQRRTTEQWEQWINFLVEMGLPLELKIDNTVKKVKLVDMNYIKSGQHLLWLHGLIRALEEPEEGFANIIKLVFKFKELDRLKKYDNYQLIQLATFFENKVTDDSPGYTHWPLGTMRNERGIPGRLIKFNTVADRFQMFTGMLSISKTSVQLVNWDRLKSITGNHVSESNIGNEHFIQRYLGLQHYNVNDRHFDDNVDTNLDTIEAFLAEAEKKIIPTMVVITNIGSHKELIKSNTYKVEAMSKNNRIVIVLDHWDRRVKTRHFKTVA